MNYNSVITTESGNIVIKKGTTIGINIPLSSQAPYYAYAPTTLVEFNIRLDARTEIFENDYLPNSNHDMASGNVYPNYKQSFPIYDSKGHYHDSTAVYFLRTESKQWSIEVVTMKPEEVVLEGYAVNTGLIAFGNATFNDNGSLHAISGLIAEPLEIHWANGADNLVRLDWGTPGTEIPESVDGRIQDMHGLYQYDNAFDAFIQANGGKYLYLAEHTKLEEKDGIIMVRYANGLELPLADETSPPVPEHTQF